MKTRYTALPRSKKTAKLLVSEKRAVVVASEASFSSLEKIFSRILGMYYHQSSAVISYGEFFAKSDELKADVLLLGNSKLFSQQLDKLRTATCAFKKNNPVSSVAVIVLDRTLEHDFRQMKVDIVESGNCDEYALLRKLSSS
ncbi:hypothetical protein JXA56_03080 [Candidatus Micrarchaeota archaeon]|nr:hypothetical protein [Candidatus Micrarchaeota archaeon]